MDYKLTGSNRRCRSARYQSNVQRKLLNNQRRKKYSYLLYLLASSGYVGGGLLDIPCNAGIALIEDSDFGKLFSREETDAAPSRNELQHVIHQSAELAIQINIVELILQ